MALPTLFNGDALDVLPKLDGGSVDAVVTDPPYGLAFMGKEWDQYTPAGYQQWCTLWAAECLRVLKPGGYLLAFGGTRTAHRLAAGIEDAGFEVRDTITWLYGSGFPKSLDVSKAIDRAAGAEREVVGARPWSSPRLDPGRGVSGLRQAGGFAGDYEGARVDLPITAPATDDARRWQGWGTALKPASEPIVVARKPFPGTVVSNVLAYGTGALNIDGCRVAAAGRAAGTTDHGRWPPNVVLSHAAAGDGGTGCASVCVDGCPVAELDGQSGASVSVARVGARPGKVVGTFGAYTGQAEVAMGHSDSGGASRFFPTFRYQAKAPRKERPRVDGVAHPTVKPLALMRWLVTLVTQEGGHVLDPFAGSGATVEAAIMDGYQVTAIEREADYMPLIEARLKAGV